MAPAACSTMPWESALRPHGQGQSNPTGSAKKKTKKKHKGGVRSRRQQRETDSHRGDGCGSTTRSGGVCGRPVGGGKVPDHRRHTFLDGPSDGPGSGGRSLQIVVPPTPAGREQRCPVAGAAEAEAAAVAEMASKKSSTCGGGGGICRGGV